MQHVDCPGLNCEPRAHAPPKGAKTSDTGRDDTAGDVRILQVCGPDQGSQRVPLQHGLTIPGALLNASTALPSRKTIEEPTMTRAARWLLPMLLLATTAHAEVTRLDITTREPALGGRAFATAGTYEKLTGRATLALDPTDPHNAVIRDLDLAPRNAQGRVEATTDIVILRPAHPNGTLLFEVLNRGRKLLPGWLDDTDAVAGSRLTTPEDGGTGFLLDQGYTLVWAGWQLDPPAAAPGAPANLGIDVPVATGPTGLSREELQFDGKPGPKRVTLSYPAADPAAAKLAMRLTADAPPTTPPGLTYAFENPSAVLITPPADAPATALYDFTYTARDPRISGMGLAAIRDVTAFLRRDTTPANPLAADGRSTIHRAIGIGISQSGRVLRDALYFGMNQDEADRLVFEGMMPIIPGARRSFTNARFAQPGRNAGPQFDRLFPVLQFPFTYPVLDDPISGKRDGIMLRCLATNACPRIIQADSEFEFWGSQASLVTTDPAGNPVDMPDNVRLFMFAGTPHGNLWNAVATNRPDCALALNPNTAAPSLRALLIAMQLWIEDGIAPPASRYPSRAQGTLVTLADAYPAIPALGYHRQQMKAEYIVQTPTGPEVRGEYPLFAPRTGLDGNAAAGIRLPILAAPRATYTGWNPVAGAEGSQDLCTQMGGVLPLPAHATPGDPRPALDQLYPTPDSYVTAVRTAAAELVAARLLLPADAETMTKAAQDGTLAKLGKLAE